MPLHFVEDPQNTVHREILGFSLSPERTIPGKEHPTPFRR